MYDKKLKSLTSHMSLPLPLPVTYCHTFLDPLWSMTYFMDGPYTDISFPTINILGSL